MASWKENLLSLQHLSDFERNTFTRSRETSPKKSTAMLLQQRLQHLRERERSAQKSNRELLQQFDQAQDILREMLSSNETMKTLRVEYERYLEKRAPYWQEQLQKRSEAVHKKRMDNYFSADLKKTEEIIKNSADQQLHSQGVNKRQQKVTPPQEVNESGSNLDYDQDISHFLASSWLIQPQSKTTVLHHLEGSSHVPPCHMLLPSTVPHLHHLDTMLGRPFPWIKQDGTDMTESPGEREVETNRGASSMRESDGGSRKRLSCGHAESGESSRTSCQGNTAGSKKKQKSQRVSSDSERCSAERSPEISMKTNHGGEKIVQSSESYSSSDEHSLRSNGRLEDAASPLMGKGTNEKNKTALVESDKDSSSSDEDSGSQINESTNEDSDAEDHCPDDGEDDSEPCKKIQPRVGGTETQTSDSSDEQSSAEEDDEEEKPGGDSGKDEEHKERRVENIHKVYVGKGSETEAEDELEHEDGEQRKHIDSHSQEEEDENKDKKITSEEESDEDEEEKMSDITGEEESDSDDVIVTPQVNRTKTKQNISESAEVKSFDDEKEESKARSLDQDSTESSEDDIENMLSPQEPTKKLETPPKVEDTPKAPRDYVQSFQVERDSPTNIIYQSDSDEFDHFYD